MLFPAGGMTINQHRKGRGGGGTYYADFFKLSHITETLMNINIINKYPIILFSIWTNQRSRKVKKGQEDGVITIDF